MKLIGGKRLMARWHDRCYARNCWSDDYQTNSNRHWRGCGESKQVNWQLCDGGLKMTLLSSAWAWSCWTACWALSSLSSRPVSGSISGFTNNFIAFALVRPACFRWLALAPGNRPSGVFFWFWHQNITTIQKQENIISFNLKFYALNSTYRSVQHNLSVVEKNSIEIDQSKSRQSDEFGGHRL